MKKHLVLTFVFCVTILEMVTGQIAYLNHIYNDNQIATYNNLHYGTGSYSYLDFYYNPANQIARPLIMMFPGSGFSSVTNGGDPKDALTGYARGLAQRGYVVAVIDYNRVPYPCNVPFKDIIALATADVNAAIQYLMYYNGVLKIDLNKMFIYGQSAGGIAATTALFWSSGKFSNTFGISKDFTKLSNIPSTSYSIKGLSLESSGLPYPQVLTQADMNANVPIVMFQGNHDVVVPFNCGTSSLCPNINTVSGTGFIRSTIDSNPAINNYYVMFEFNCDNHNMLSLLGDNMFQLIANFYYNLMTNAPQVGSPPAQNVPNCNPTGPALPASCPAVTSVLREGVFDVNQNNLSESDYSVFIKEKELILSFNDATKSTVSIYDMTGILKKSKTVEAGQTMTMADLPTGLYVVIVENNNQVIRKKILLD